MIYLVIFYIIQELAEINSSDDEGSLTDVGSTCSGLTDISGMSDLDDIKARDLRDYAIDFGAPLVVSSHYSIKKFLFFNFL